MIGSTSSFNSDLNALERRYRSAGSPDSVLYDSCETILVVLPDASQCGSPRMRHALQRLPSRMQLIIT